MLYLDSVSRLGFFDHQRALEQLTHLAGECEALGATGAIGFPLASLARLGQDLLNATDADHGAARLRWDMGATHALAGIEVCRALAGTVPLNALLVAVALARGDLWGQFAPAGRFLPDAALRWLTLHGIAEHGLWHMLTRRFVDSLRSPARQPDGRLVPPLAVLVMAERPDLVARFTSREGFKRAAFEAWLLGAGVAEYRLWWCLTADERMTWLESGGQNSLPLSPLEPRTSRAALPGDESAGGMAVTALLKPAEADRTDTCFRAFSVVAPDTAGPLRPPSAPERGAYGVSLLAQRWRVALPAAAGRCPVLVLEILGLDGARVEPPVRLAMAGGEGAAVWFQQGPGTGFLVVPLEGARPAAASLSGVLEVDMAAEPGCRLGVGERLELRRAWMG